MLSVSICFKANPTDDEWSRLPYSDHDDVRKAAFAWRKGKGANGHTTRHNWAVHMGEIDKGIPY